MTLEDYPVPYLEETTPLPVTEKRFQEIKQALRDLKNRRKVKTKYRFKKDILEDKKVGYTTLWRIERSRTFKQYQERRRK